MSFGTHRDSILSILTHCGQTLGALLLQTRLHILLTPQARSKFIDNVRLHGLSAAVQAIDMDELKRDKVDRHLKQTADKSISTWLSFDLIQVEMKNMVILLDITPAKRDQLELCTTLANVEESTEVASAANPPTKDPIIKFVDEMEKLTDCLVDPIFDNVIEIQAQDLLVLAVVEMGSTGLFEEPKKEDIRSARDNFATNRKTDELARAVVEFPGGKRLFQAATDRLRATASDEVADNMFEHSDSALSTETYDPTLGLRSFSEIDDVGDLAEVLGTASVVVHKLTECFVKWTSGRRREHGSSLNERIQSIGHALAHSDIVILNHVVNKLYTQIQPHYGTAPTLLDGPTACEIVALAEHAKVIKTTIDTVRRETILKTADMYKRMYQTVFAEGTLLHATEVNQSVRKSVLDVPTKLMAWDHSLSATEAICQLAVLTPATVLEEIEAFDKWRELPEEQRENESIPTFQYVIQYCAARNEAASVDLHYPLYDEDLSYFSQCLPDFDTFGKLLNSGRDVFYWPFQAPLCTQTFDRFYVNKIDECLDTFMRQVDLGALLWSQTPADVESHPISKRFRLIGGIAVEVLAKRFVHEPPIVDGIASLELLPVKTQPYMKSLRVLQLMVRQSPTLTVPRLAVQSEEGEMMPGTDVLALAEIFADIQSVYLGLAAGSYLIAGGEFDAKRSSLETLYAELVSVVGAKIQDAQLRISPDWVSNLDNKGYVLTYGVQFLKRWLANARVVADGHVFALISAWQTELSNIANETLKACPNYDAFFGPGYMNRPQCFATLLPKAIYAKLHTAQKQLVSAFITLQKLSKHIPLNPPVEHHPVTKNAYNTATDIRKKASLTLAVISGARVVLEEAHLAKSSEVAKDVLAHAITLKAILPDALQTALERVAGGAPPFDDGYAHGDGPVLKLCDGRAEDTEPKSSAGVASGTGLCAVAKMRSAPKRGAPEAAAGSNEGNSMARPRKAVRRSQAPSESAAN